MDLRERVVAAVDAGLTQSQAAAVFGVSLRSVERYLARRRATGILAASEQRHGPGADGAPPAAGLAARSAGRRGRCHAGRARGGVPRRQR
ncbi:helix-turn-helix domain-containing protein [Geodermatophilus bullaregiensis]|uniref:helix-turn-helix domain-containing protein n=1 Tax=Geodermatophilus bullaregiensis TaxID=1564160 RepID=UPI00195AEB30